MPELALPSFHVNPASRRVDPLAARFAAAALVVIVLSAVLAGFVPLQFSIVTVFLFAGPHNWVEFRYFLSRMPARWGRMRTFYLTAIGGVLSLTLAYIAMPVLARHFSWSDRALNNAAAAWMSALVLWIAVLVVLRHDHKVLAAAREDAPARKREWLLPLGIAFVLVSGVWIYPAAWDVGIVYAHPVVALWFLDREIARHRPAWLWAYRRCLWAVPCALGVLWWRLIHAPPLAGNDMLTMRITQHAGAGVITGISSHALVSTHTFLEMLHYGVWLVAIPLVTMRVAPWNLAAAPLARQSARWRWVVMATGVVGLLIVLGLWGSFLINYPLTRDVYFTVAIGHVLAEVSFLLRLL